MIHPLYRELNMHGVTAEKKLETKNQIIALMREIKEQENVVVTEYNGEPNAKRAPLPPKPSTGEFSFFCEAHVSPDVPVILTCEDEYARFCSRSPAGSWVLL